MAQEKPVHDIDLNTWRTDDRTINKRGNLTQLIIKVEFEHKPTKFIQEPRAKC